MDAQEKEIFKSYVNALRLCMDTNCDPFENFVEYALGNMRNLRDNPDVKKIRDELMYMDLTDFFLKSENSTPMLDKYRVCRELYESNVKDILQCDGLRQYCDGWPAFNANWNPDNFNLSQTLGSLNALGFYAIITVNVIYKENKRLIEITFSLPHYETYNEDGIDSTKAYETLKKFELSDLKAEDVINDLNYVAEKLREMNLDNLFFDYTRQRLTREEIANRQEFNYISFVEAAIGEIEESDIFYICTYYGDVLFPILQCLSDLDPKVLANYVMISATYDFSQYSKIIEESFYPLLIENALSRYTNSDSDKRYIEVAEYFLRTAEKVKDQVESEFIEENEDQLRDRKLIGQYKNMFFSEEKLAKEYESLEIVSDDFYQNITNLQRWGPPELVRQFLGNSVAYNVFRDYVNFAIKTYKKPMLQCILTNDYDNWFSVLKEQNIDSDEYKEKVNKLQSITKELIALQNEEQHNNENDEDKNIEIESYYYDSALNTIRALRLMFATYKDWLHKNEAVANEQNEILSEIGLNNYQFFFVVFAVTYLMQLVENEAYTVNIKDNLCFVGMEEFIDEFKCKSTKFKNLSLGQ